MFFQFSCLKKKDSIFESAQSKFKEYDYLGCLSDVSVILADDSTNLSAIRLRGLANFYLKNYNDAIIDFNYVIGLNKKDSVVLSRRGDILFYSIQEF